MKPNFLFPLASTALALICYQVLPAQAASFSEASSTEGDSAETTMVVATSSQQKSSNLSEYLEQLTNSCQEHFSSGSSPSQGDNSTVASTPEPATMAGLAFAVGLGLTLKRRHDF